MATKFSSTLLPSNATDADFRAWAQFVEDLLVTTGGWVVTSDTGQMTISTATKPGFANTKVGYRIYRMNDSLQGTFPIFMKVAYGSGAVASTPGIWFQIGTGSDGSGNITGTLTDQYTPTSPPVEPNSNAGSGSFSSYGSSDAGRFCFFLFGSSVSTNYCMLWTLERSINASGARTGDGLILTWNDADLFVNKSLYVAYTGTQPAIEGGLQYILSSSNPSAFGGDIGIGVHIPIKGIAQQPGTQICVVRYNDIGTFGSFTMSMYGTSHTYQRGGINLQARSAVNGSQDSGSGVAIQYD